MRTDTICTISAGTDFRNQVLSRLYRLPKELNGQLSIERQDWYLRRRLF